MTLALLQKRFEAVVNAALYPGHSPALPQQFESWK